MPVGVITPDILAQRRQFGIAEPLETRHAVGHQRPVPNDRRKSHGVEGHRRCPQIGRMTGRDDIDAMA